MQSTPAPSGTAPRPPLPAPPVLPGLPVVGSAFAAARDPLRFFLDGHRRLGPIYRFRALGRGAIVMAGREANRFVAKHAREYLTSAEFFSDFGKVYDADIHLPGAGGEVHTRLRRLLGPTIGRRVGERQRKTLGDLAAEQAAMCIGRDVDAVDFVRRLVGVQLGTTLAGHRADESFEALQYVLQVMLDVTVAKRSPAIRMRMPKYLRMKREVDSLSAQVVDAHRPGGHLADREDVIAAVLAGERDGMLAPNDVTLLSMMPYQAGLDTVSHTMAFALYHLVADRTLYDEVTSEVDRCFEGTDDTGPDLAQLPLLTRVVKETLRRHPVAFALMRHAAKGFEFAGHTVKRGEHVIVVTTATHFDPEFFPDPERFDPSRFDETRTGRPKTFVYAPYGVGPTTCLGAGLAEVQLVTTLAALLRSVELRLTDPSYRLRTRYTPSGRPDRLLLKLSPRAPSHA